MTTYNLFYARSFGTFFFLLVVVVVIVFIIIYDNKRTKKKREELQRKIMMLDSKKPETVDNDEDIEKLPYRRKFLLTKNEYWFYKSLKEITDKYDFAVLAKIRFADLVEVSAEADKKEYMKYFGKIKSKHIDFILCKKDNLYPELLIELNDSSHNTEDRIKRDEFIKKIAEKVGYKMVFVDGTQNLEETIIKALEIKSENNNDPPIDEKKKNKVKQRGS